MTADPRACIEPEGEWELLVQADHDGELDAGQAAPVVAHLRACAHCARWQRDLAILSGRVRAEADAGTAPPGLRRSLMAQGAGRRSFAGPLAGLGVGAVLAASLVLAFYPVGPDGMDPLVTGHIRAQQPGHLTDVASSDRHTVKPWFEGRLDFAPPVRDLSAAGFTLVGGRLDYLYGRAAAALVYRRAKHDIEVYVWPGARRAAPSAQTLRGFAVVSWAEGGMELRAISDMEAADLLAFARAWIQAPEVGEPPR